MNREQKRRLDELGLSGSYLYPFLGYYLFERDLSAIRNKLSTEDLSLIDGKKDSIGSYNIYLGLAMIVLPKLIQKILQ